MRKSMTIKWRKNLVGIDSESQGWNTKPGDLVRFFEDVTPGGVEVLMWMEDPAMHLAQKAIRSSFCFKDMSENEIRAEAREFIGVGPK
jgi:hypothetical protein